MSPTTTTTRRYASLMDPLTYPSSSAAGDTGARSWDLVHGWKLAHNNAVTGPRPGAEAGIVSLLRGWLAYADAYEAQFKYTISPSDCLYLNDTNTNCADCHGQNAAIETKLAALPTQDAREAVYPQYQSYTEICLACSDCSGGRIGSDSVLGIAWALIGRHLLTLLCGDLGRLDGGTLDGIVRSAFRLAGLSDTGE